MVKFEIICYQPIDKTINSGLEIKCLVYKMVSHMFHVMYHTRHCFIVLIVIIVGFFVAFFFI